MMDEKELRLWFIILVVLLAVALVITVIVLVKNSLFQRTFAQGKFKMNANVYVDPDTEEKSVELILANKTINPISVTSVGLIYNDKRIELMDILCADSGMSSDNAFCPARNQLKIIYSYEKCYEYFVQNGKVKKIVFFVMDNIGNETKLNAKLIRKNIKNDVKGLKKNPKNILKAESPSEKETNLDSDFNFDNEDVRESSDTSEQ